MRRSSSMGSSIVVGVALAVAPWSARADFEMPHQTPDARVVQQIGLTEVTVDYDRSSVNGRKIWGAVVPYDAPWTIGAKAAARIRFSKDVTIAEKLVPAGSYWLLATPGRAMWTVMLNKSAEPLTSPREYKPELDVVRVRVKARPTAHREALTFLFSELSDDGASLDLEWDAQRLSVPLRVNTSQQMLSAIGELDNAWRSFANAARYMLEVKKDFDAGLRYIDQSLALHEDWYSLWVKATLLACKSRYVEADETAERAYELAKKTGGAGFALEPELKLAIADWRGKAHLLEKERAAPKPAARTTAGEPASLPALPAATAASPQSDPPLRRARLRRP